MFKIIVLMMLLASPQLNPSLTPQKAPKPDLPKIDEKACPFEGCQFGAWTATDRAQLFSTWKEGRTPVALVSVGETVTAITGVHITFEPSEIQVTAPIADYGLKPGDTVFGYMYKGEGVFSAWFNGYWVEDFDGSGVEGAGCNRKCNAKLIKEGRVEWWVEIKLKNGIVGWTKDTDKFSGKDAGLSCDKSSHHQWKESKKIFRWALFCKSFTLCWHHSGTMKLCETCSL